MPGFKILLKTMMVYHINIMQVFNLTLFNKCNLIKLKESLITIAHILPMYTNYIKINKSLALSRA